MPELLRAYGEALRPEDPTVRTVLIGLLLVAAALSAVFATGALASGVRRSARWVARRRSAHR